MLQIDLSRIWQQLIYNPKEPLLFSSGLFIFLFTGFMYVYFLVYKHHRAKTIFVTLFSLYFYYKSSGIYFLLLILSAIVDFSLANAIFRAESERKRKLILILSLVLNLGLLAYFKYTNFFYSIICDLTAQSFSPMSIFLPVGISFFTFQSLSYTFDIYRGTLKPVKSFLDYAFFVTFFPQLVAGPIVRAADFIPQIFKPIKVTDAMIGRGIFLIASGVIKKVVIADFISANFVDQYLNIPHFIPDSKTCLAFMAMPCRFIAISRAIPTWPSVLLCSWDFILKSILIPLINRRISQSFGEGGISRCLPGLKITSISR